jgi:hypothetical protein
MNSPRLLAPLAALSAAVALLIAPPHAAAGGTAQLGNIVIIEGSSGSMPVSLTMDADLEFVALTVFLNFDGLRIGIDLAAPMMGGHSLADLAMQPGWLVHADEMGVVIDAVPANPVLLAATVPYAGQFSFAGLVAGPDAVPVSLEIQLCDLSHCFFGGSPPMVITAVGSVMVNAIPEPPRWALWVGGLLVLGQWVRRRSTAL